MKGVIDMKNSEKATEHFNGGFNCAASVLSSFCEDYELDAELAAKLACGLGGGCGDGEVCGAVSASVLIVGLKYGQHVPGDMGTKTNCYAKTKQFMDAFKEKHGVVTCRGLLAGVDGFGEEEALKERRRLCAQYVKDAAEILEEQGY